MSISNVLAKALVRCESLKLRLLSKQKEVSSEAFFAICPSMPLFWRVLTVSLYFISRGQSLRFLLALASENLEVDVLPGWLRLEGWNLGDGLAFLWVTGTLK